MTCTYCNQPSDNGPRMCTTCRKQRANESQKRWLRRRRREVLDHYGGECACCGETTYEFLQFEHTSNDGADRRRENGIAGERNRIFRELPEDIAVLCANCNAARGFYGRCPHEDQR